MGVLGKIFGSDKAIEEAFGLIDDLWETDAEKRKSRAKAKIQLMQAYEPFKIAQRYIAFAFTFTYLVCFFGIQAATLFDLLTPEKLQAIRDIMQEFMIGWIMTTIVLFYFGGGLTESMGRAGIGTNKPLARKTRKKEIQSNE